MRCPPVWGQSPWGGCLCPCSPRGGLRLPQEGGFEPRELRVPGAASLGLAWHSHQLLPDQFPAAQQARAGPAQPSGVWHRGSCHGAPRPRQLAGHEPPVLRSGWPTHVCGATHAVLVSCCGHLSSGARGCSVDGHQAGWLGRAGASDGLSRSPLPQHAGGRVGSLAWPRPAWPRPGGCGDDVELWR